MSSEYIRKWLLPYDCQNQYWSSEMLKLAISCSYREGNCWQKTSVKMDPAYWKWWEVDCRLNSQWTPNFISLLQEVLLGHNGDTLTTPGIMARLWCVPDHCLCCSYWVKSGPVNQGWSILSQIHFFKNGWNRVTGILRFSDSILFVFTMRNFPQFFTTQGLYYPEHL